MDGCVCVPWLQGGTASSRAPPAHGACHRCVHECVDSIVFVFGIDDGERLSCFPQCAGSCGVGVCRRRRRVCNYLFLFFVCTVAGAHPSSRCALLWHHSSVNRQRYNSKPCVSVHRPRAVRKRMGTPTVSAHPPTLPAPPNESSTQHTILGLPLPTSLLHTVHTNASSRLRPTRPRPRRHNPAQE